MRFTTLRVSPAQGFNLDKVEVSRDTGEFVLGSLIREVDREEVNDLAVRSWLEKASGESANYLPASLIVTAHAPASSSRADSRSTLVFAISKSHILSITNTFRRYGVDAKYVYHDTKPAERQEIYEGFKNGTFKVLVNCGILTEGGTSRVESNAELTRS